MTFAMKWWITETVPLGLILLLLCMVGTIKLYSCCHKKYRCFRKCNREVAFCCAVMARKMKTKQPRTRQSKKTQMTGTPLVHVDAEDKLINTLIGGCVSVMYYLYTLLVRGAFEIFDCEQIGVRVDEHGKNITVSLFAVICVSFFWF